MLVLASASPRRRELLTQAGFHFEVEPSDIPETRRPGEDPIHFATRLAREKAQSVQHRLGESPASSEPLLVLGADTVVVVDDEVLGKPASAEDAVRMLRLLRGRTHQVITGVCITAGRMVETAAEVTFVAMETLTDEEIADYVSSGEPLDKAGAYAIQGRAARWIPRIQGCYFNVVGLPIALVTSIIEGVRARLHDASGAAFDHAETTTTQAAGRSHSR